MRFVTLLTDFGTTDYYVAALKGTLLRLAPDAIPLDLTHDIPPGDIETGSYLLAAALPSFPPQTVHVAVVDPGVGSERRILAIVTPFGTLLAPDNGLATAFVAHRTLAVERPDLYLETPGATFHGRDRFSPVAAFLLRGGSVSELGNPVHDAQRLQIPAPRQERERLQGRVAHIDRYGNVITDIPAAWFSISPLSISLGVARIRDHSAVRFVSHYAAIPPGEPALLVGSLGTLELALNGHSLAAAWSVERGDHVVIELRPHADTANDSATMAESSRRD